MRDLEGTGRRARAYACAIVATAVAFCATAGAADDAWAQQEARSDTAAATDTADHVVRLGDTLWDLADEYYDDPYSWPMIHEANLGEVDDPHWIYPQERLRIPGLLAGATLPDRLAPRRRGEDPLLGPRTIRRTVFWDPALAAVSDAEDATVITTEAESTERAVRPGEFRAAPWLARPDALPVVARMESPVEPTRGLGVERAAVHRYDEVLLSPEGGTMPEVAERLLLVRPERRIESRGRLVRPVAVVRVAAASGDDMITAEVIDHFDRIDDGDLAIPLPEYPVPTGVSAQPVDEGPTGRIIAFETEQLLYGVPDRAFLDVGAATGVEVGDEFVAYLPPRSVRGDGPSSTPSEPVAELLVLRTTERTATVRVTSLRHPVLEPGLPVHLVRKMP